MRCHRRDRGVRQLRSGSHAAAGSTAQLPSPSRLGAAHHVMRCRQPAAGPAVTVLNAMDHALPSRAAGGRAVIVTSASHHRRPLHRARWWRGKWPWRCCCPRQSSCVCASPPPPPAMPSVRTLSGVVVAVLAATAARILASSAVPRPAAATATAVWVAAWADVGHDSTRASRSPLLGPATAPAPLWTAMTVTSSPLVTADGMVIVAEDFSDTLSSLYPNGSVAWQQTLPGLSWATLVPSGGIVVLANHTLAVLDEIDGSQLVNTTFSGSPNDLIVPDADHIVLATSEYLLLLNTTDLQLLSNRSIPTLYTTVGPPGTLLTIEGGALTAWQYPQLDAPPVWFLIDGQTSFMGFAFDEQYAQMYVSEYYCTCVYAVDAISGRIAWTANNGSTILIAPTVSQTGLVIVWSTNASQPPTQSTVSLQALSPIDGTIVWKTPQYAAQYRALDAAPAPIVDGANIVYWMLPAYRGAQLRALNGTNGAQLWVAFLAGQSAAGPAWVVLGQSETLFFGPQLAAYAASAAMRVP